jgi:hypothetical protein
MGWNWTCNTSNNQQQAYPEQVSLDTLKSLKKGDIYKSDHGFVPDFITSDAYSYLNKRGNDKYNNYKFFPNNGEFEFVKVDRGNNLCSFEYGCKCPNSGIVGYKPGIQRISYKGNTLNCCLNRSVLDDNSTCDPSLRSVTNPACDSELLNYCTKDKNGNPTGSKIFNDSCKKFEQDLRKNNRYNNPNIYNNINTSKQIYCGIAPSQNQSIFNKMLSAITGENTMTFTSQAQQNNCVDWCSKVANEDVSSYKQCELYNWERNYCKDDKLLSDAICVNYCNPLSTDIASQEWCKTARQNYCKQQYDLYKSKGDEELLKWLQTTECACYLPDEVYNSYSDNLKKKIGSSNQLVLDYIDTHKKCLFPACAKQSKNYNHETCPDLMFCVQDVTLNITDSKITGSADVNASQKCALEIQNQKGCEYTYGNWSDCVNGSQSRTKTLSIGDVKTCYPGGTESQSCTIPTSPTTPDTTTTTPDTTTTTPSTTTTTPDTTTTTPDTTTTTPGTTTTPSIISFKDLSTQDTIIIIVVSIIVFLLIFAILFKLFR